MNNNKIYSEDSIKSINPREFCRLRSGVYAGSTEYSTQLLREIFSNSLDEHLIGHGNKITIEIDTENNIYTVTDNGQGFPVNSFRDDGETIFSASLGILNTSGKYDENGVYGGSAQGLNGIGIKLTNYLSTYLDGWTSNGSGKEEYVRFEDGLFIRREIHDVPTARRGTKISYHPDPQFFEHKEVNLSEFKEFLDEISALCPQLSVSLVVDKKEQIFHSENGIADLLNKKINGKEIVSNRFRITKKKNDNLFDICLTYTTDYIDNIISYVNYGKTEAGVHITSLKTALTKAINKYARDKNLLKEKDENLTGTELAEGLVVVFNLKANGVQYDSQSKVRVVGIDRSLITETINNDFMVWMEKNPKDIKAIVEKALQARKAREAARKAKEAIRGNKDNKKAIKFDSKLADCNSKDRSKCEIYITEGK